MTEASDKPCKDDKPAGRVILTYGRSLMALVIARSLAERGIEVIGCDDVDLTVLSFSRFVKETFVHPSPWTDPDGFLEVMEEKVQAFAPHPDDDCPYILMPVFEETRLLTEHRDRFEPTIRVAAPQLSSLDAVEPKDRLARTAGAIGLDVPETLILDGPEDALEQARSLTFPRLIKPVSGVGGRGIKKLDDFEALETHLAAKPASLSWPALLQELVPGEDYCCTVLVERGEIRAADAYRNVTTFPREAGAGAVRERVDPAPFLETAGQIMGHTEWNGVAQIDFRWDESRTPKLIEVNARFWAGLFHSVASGIDYPWLLYCLAAGLDIPDARPDPDAVVTRSPGIWFLSIIDETVDTDESIGQLKDVWRRAAGELGEGQLWRAIATLFSDPALKGVDLGATLQHMRDRMATASKAPSEFSRTDDPFVGLGALFVLASLYRHGKLPAELTHKNHQEEEKPDKASRPDRPHRDTRPLIGITRPEKGDRLAYLSIRFALWLAGARTIPLTARAPGNPHMIDGLVFGGGSDIYPDRFGGEAKPGYRYDIARDDMEASWDEAARVHDLPVLGICRGVQMMNVLAGGTLHGDLGAFPERDYPASRWRQMIFRKTIEIAEDTLLLDLTGTPRLSVNAIHQQAIDQIGTGYRAVAWDHNGLIQAIEDPSRSFALGVQFHPEFLIYRKTFRDLFHGLVKAAQQRAADKAALGEPD